jgi:DNA-binding NtrC family response regulator
MKDHIRKVVGIADADPDWLSRLRKAIERLGFSVLASQNGRDFLLPLRNGTLSVLIVDTQLKDMSGTDLVSTIKEIDPGFPVVVTTKDYSKNLELACRKMGIIFYARKPLNFEVIRWIVRRNSHRPDEEMKVTTDTAEES